jgi:hypothetical protein
VSWRQVACVVVECDGCGDGWTGDDYDGRSHFPDREAALDGLSAAGWTVDGDEMLCADCAVMQACERAGHDWTLWRAAGPFARPQGAWQGRIRYCDGCPDSQWDPPLTPATTTAPRPAASRPTLSMVGDAPTLGVIGGAA